MCPVFQVNSSGDLVCRFSNGRSVAAPGEAHGVEGLREAVEEAGRTGLGEAFWSHPFGEVRWLLRREGERLDVHVHWSTGTLTGWEEVWRGECGVAELSSALAVIRIQPGG